MKEQHEQIGMTRGQVLKGTAGAIGVGAIKLNETAISIKTIRYCTDTDGGTYAVTEYRRKSDGKVFRSRIVHGA